MKNVLLSAVVALTSFSFAQKYVHQVIVLNEGKYAYGTSTIIAPVTIGSYDPSSGIYKVVNTLSGMRFASDAIIQGDAYYVAADQKIFKFDLNTHVLLAETTVPGVRNLAYSDGKIVATRGEYETTYDSYLQIFNASDLSLVRSINTTDGPKWATQNMISVGNEVYVAVNNGYEWGKEKGIIGRLDMNTLTYGNEIDLGVNGINPDNMVLLDGSLYTVNNKNWSGSSISKIALDGSENTTVNIAAASTGCGTSALRDDYIVYQISGENILNEFKASLMNNVGPITGFDKSYYALAQNPVDGKLYASVTDYVTFGKVLVYDGNNEIKSFDVGVAPGKIIFDVRSLSGLNQTAQTNDVSIFPNPVNDALQIRVDKAAQLQVTDLSGKSVLTAELHGGLAQVQMHAIPSGTYICKLTFDDGNQSIQKITKI